MTAVGRWLAAVAAGVIVFEGLDALAGAGPATAWVALGSPFVAGGVAGWGAAGSAASCLFASAATVWARIGADRTIGILHGVHQPLEMELVVAVIFGFPWMAMAVAGGIVVLFLRRRSRPTAASRHSRRN